LAENRSLAVVTPIGAARVSKWFSRLNQNPRGRGTRGRETSGQSIYQTKVAETWPDLPAPADVILPKEELCRSVVGELKFTVLVALKNSPRKLNCTCSLMGILFSKAAFQVMVPKDRS
jgi:hypothetical protein